MKELSKTTHSSRVRSLALSSRKNLCINRRLISNPAIVRSALRLNEACLDMQRPSKEVDEEFCCEYFYPANKEQSSEFYEQFIRESFRQPSLDVEDLHKLGSSLKICPYYGSHKSLPYAQFITVPYAFILHEDTRQALEIDLHDSVIIFDEAHNVVDALRSLYEVEVSETLLRNLKDDLNAYLKAYEKRLSGWNLRHLTITIKCVSVLLDAMIQLSKEYPGGSILQQQALIDRMPSDFMESFNFHKLKQFVNERELSRKILGYAQKRNRELRKQIDVEQMPSQQAEKFLEELSEDHRRPLDLFIEFLCRLTNDVTSGRIALSVNRKKILKDGQIGESKEWSLRYLVLYCAPYFDPILRKARSIIFAGGTLEPIEDLEFQLFPAPLKAIKRFSCGHIIPPSNLLLLNLAYGPSISSTSSTVKPLKFTFETRHDASLYQEFTLTLLNFIRVIPDGVVVFFASYAALDLMLSYWQNTVNPEGESYFVLLEQKKRIFTEKESMSTTMLLEAYQEFCDPNSDVRQQSSSGTLNGAILLSVVNGKLSEGINFSDRNGRGIFLIGLPFPKITDPILIEQKKYYDFEYYRRKGLLDRCTGPVAQPEEPANSQPQDHQRLSEVQPLKATSNSQSQPLSTASSSSSSSSSSGSLKSQFLENLCMKATNQTIGRVLRHGRDYAVIFLCDIRFEDDAIKNKLPSWMRPHYRNYFFEFMQKSGKADQRNPFGRCIQDVVKFFKEKRETKSKE